MRRYLLANVLVALAGISVFAVPAVAADLPPLLAKAPAAPPPFSWSGFYVGINAGADWQRDDFTSTITGCDAVPRPAQCTGSIGHLGSSSSSAVAAQVAAAGTGSNTKVGGTGGGQFGFNWQTGGLVLGAEADIEAIGGAPAIGTNRPLDPFTGSFFSVTDHASADWLATVRGRIGYAADRLLFYATGGAAFTRINFSQSYSDIFGGPLLGTPLTAFSASSTRTGYAVGAGVEYAFAGNWSARGDYLFAGGFGEVGGSYLAVAGTGNADVHSASVKLDVQMVRLGLNYRFY